MMASSIAEKNISLVILFIIIFAIQLTQVNGRGCDHVIKTKQGIMKSPNHPNQYKPSQYCTWKFETFPGHRITLTFTDFELEQVEDCKYDYIELYDGGEKSNDTFLGRFCEFMPPPIISTRNKLFLIFSSDHSVQKRGFNATYKSEFPGFQNVNMIEVNELERHLTQNIRSYNKNVINKWGTDVTRTAVALYLTDDRFFAVNNETGKEIGYELTLQLMSKLVLKKRISTEDLAHFVNAMTVACINSEAFFGVNIVNELHKRVDNSDVINPFSVLSLCNAGGHMKKEYVKQLKKLFYAILRPSWIDTQAMVVMALQCISRKLNINLDDTLKEMVSELKRKQQNNGTIDNLENTALVIQALMATESFETNFNLSEAIKSIIKDVKKIDVGIEEIYYILPILGFRTLLDISSHHCESFIKTDLKVNLDERIQVQISILIGDNSDFSSTRRIKVSPGTSLHDVLENISASEPGYRIRYKTVGGKPYVAGVGNLKDNIADGLFWFIHKKPLFLTGNSILVEESPVDIQVSESDEMILWYRPIKWSDRQELSTDNYVGSGEGSGEDSGDSSNQESEVSIRLIH